MNANCAEGFMFFARELGWEDDFCILTWDVENNIPLKKDTIITTGEYCIRVDTSNSDEKKSVLFKIFSICSKMTKNKFKICSINYKLKLKQVEEMLSHVEYNPDGSCFYVVGKVNKNKYSGISGIPDGPLETFFGIIFDACGWN